MEIAAANPGVDPFVPEPGRRIVIPTEWILPDAPIRNGIIVNIAEMRLFLLRAERARMVATFPIGVGDEGTETPVGVYSIVEKVKNPAWNVPRSIRVEQPDLPAVVPPGPDNPLGSRALRLSDRTLLIHGTNRPWGIGTRSSHGCIRLYEEDIARLSTRRRSAFWTPRDWRTASIPAAYGRPPQSEADSSWTSRNGSAARRSSA